MYWILILISFLIALAGFGPATRKYIFWRDRAQCVECGRKWKDGWMLHAAHYDHSKNNGYNRAENGRLLCIRCHINDHKRLLASSNEDRPLHRKALQKLNKLPKRNIHYKAR